LTFHTGKAVVQITAIEIAADHLLDIGPPESVLPGEIFVIDLDKGLKIALYTAVVIRILRISWTMTATPERAKQIDFSLTYFFTWKKFTVKKGTVKNLAPSRCSRVVDTEKVGLKFLLFPLLVNEVYTNLIAARAFINNYIDNLLSL
jgi:ABC-type amino acid transport substrate-binding protein